MDLGFFVVAIAISIPFIVLSIGLNLRAKQHKAQELEFMLKRIGVETNQVSQAKMSIKNLSSSRFLVPAAIVLKRAGLQDKKTITKLMVIQALLIVFSSYVIVTRGEAILVKELAIAIVLPFFPFLFVLIKLKQRQDAMRKQFPEMLDGLVRSLYSGYGIDGALGLIAEEFPAPLGKEMKEVNKQLSLGVSMKDVLREFQNRVDLPEAQFFVVTLIIQRETGGQLASILSELSRLMRRRESFQAKLKTLTAESRFTALFIGAAPILYLAYKYLFAPESMVFFMEDPTGQKMLMVSIGLIAVGTIILKSMLKMRF